MGHRQRERGPILASSKEREEFAGAVSRGLTNVSVAVAMDVARKLLRNAATYQRLAEEECNGHPWQANPARYRDAAAINPPGYMDAAAVDRAQTAWDARIERQQEATERRIAAICAEHGMGYELQGDPRGWCVKVTIGGREIGVPA